MKSEPGSLKERLAQRREELHAERQFTVPLIGYEDLGIHVRYRVLNFKALRKIGDRHERERDQAEREVLASADTLITACVEILEQRDGGEYVSTGLRWSVEAARELFGCELPDDSTSRMALRAVLPDSELMLHFSRYDEALSRHAPEVEETVAGESEAR